MNCVRRDRCLALRLSDRRRAYEAAVTEHDSREPTTEALEDDDAGRTALFVGPVGRPDEYQLVGRGARGGEGIVWRAWYRNTLPLPIDVAVKQLLAPGDRQPAEWPSASLIDSWYEQLRLLQAVHLDHVAAYRELFAGWPPHQSADAHDEPPSCARSWYLVMEWIDGPTLDAIVASRQVSLPERLRLVVDIAKAVDDLHSGEKTYGMPVLHRDIKPANIVVHPSRGAVLVDLGLLRVEQAAMTEMPRWTSPYLAPELHANKSSSSRSSDVWSLAATAFFALTGQHPSPMNPDHMRSQLRHAGARRLPAISTPQRNRVGARTPGHAGSPACCARTQRVGASWKSLSRRRVRTTSVPRTLGRLPSRRDATRGGDALGSLSSPHSWRSG